MHLAGLQNGRACVRGCNGVKGRSSEVAVLESPGMVWKVGSFLSPCWSLGVSSETGAP